MLKIKNLGFTLIELVVTVFIVAILAATAQPLVELTLKRNKESELKQCLREIRGAIDLYKKAVDEGKIKVTLDQTGYPKSLEVLEKGAVDQKDPKGRIIKFIRKIPRDPMNDNPELKPIETWATRCYDSDAGFPVEGADVYDVHSRSIRKAIDGSIYNSW